MSIFRRKNEFRPDKERAGTLSKLYITKKQRASIARWVLTAAMLTLICVLQDVLMSRITIFGAHTDLLSCGILLVCIMLDPEVGSIFVLIASLLYQFSGSAPGPYVIAVLTGLGVLIGIVRHCYLREGFGATFLCTAVAVMLYELIIFATGLFLGRTTGARFGIFCISGALSILAVPVMYPIFAAIGKIGGKSWKE